MRTFILIKKCCFNCSKHFEKRSVSTLLKRASLKDIHNFKRIPKIVLNIDKRNLSLKNDIPIQFSYPSFCTTNFYPLSEFHSKFSHLKNEQKETSNITKIAGRVIAKREHGKKLAFLDVIQDNKQIQVVLMKKRFACEEEFHTLAEHTPLNSHIEISGHPGRTKSGELSIYGNSGTLLSPCLHTVPLELKNHNVRFRKRYLDFLVNPSNLKVFQTRATILRTIRTYLDNQGFIEIETPTLVAMASGAIAKPFNTHFDSGKLDLQMRIAPELPLKQLIIGGLDRIYEIGKQFRNEGLSKKHNPEFTTVEFYETYNDFEGLVSRTESLLNEIVLKTNNGSSVITIENREEEEDVSEEVSLDFSTPFNRIDVLPFLEERTQAKLDVDDPELEAKMKDILERHELPFSESTSKLKLFDSLVSHFIEPECIQPTFLCYFPSFVSPLAKDVAGKPGISDRFELFVNGNEICNAYVELNDPVVQKERFSVQEKAYDDGDSEAMKSDDHFCEALEYGLPPTVGWGMGVDRLVMILTNKRHIREVLAFPLTKDAAAES